MRSIVMTLGWFVWFAAAAPSLLQAQLPRRAVAVAPQGAAPAAAQVEATASNLRVEARERAAVTVGRVLSTARSPGRRRTITTQVEGPDIQATNSQLDVASVTLVSTTGKRPPPKVLWRNTARTRTDKYGVTPSLTAVYQVAGDRDIRRATRTAERRAAARGTGTTVQIAPVVIDANSRVREVHTLVEARRDIRVRGF